MASNEYTPCTPYFHSGVRVSGRPLRNTSLTPSPLVSASNLSYSPSLYDTLADNVNLSVTAAVPSSSMPCTVTSAALKNRVSWNCVPTASPGHVSVATAEFGTQTRVTSARCASVYST